MSINLLPWREHKIKKQAIFVLFISIVIALIACLIMILSRQKIEFILAQNNSVNDQLQQALDHRRHSENKHVVQRFNQYLIQAQVIKKTMIDFNQMMHTLNWLCQNYYNISFAQISIVPPNIVIQATAPQSGMVTQWAQQITKTHLFSNAVISQIQTTVAEKVHFEINLIIKEGQAHVA